MKKIKVTKTFVLLLVFYLTAPSVTLADPTRFLVPPDIDKEVYLLKENLRRLKQISKRGLSEQQQIKFRLSNVDFLKDIIINYEQISDKYEAQLLFSNLMQSPLKSEVFAAFKRAIRKRWNLSLFSGIHEGFYELVSSASQFSRNANNEYKQDNFQVFQLGSTLYFVECLLRHADKTQANSKQIKRLKLIKSDMEVKLSFALKQYPVDKEGPYKALIDDRPFNLISGLNREFYNEYLDSRMRDVQSELNKFFLRTTNLEIVHPIDSESTLKGVKVCLFAGPKDEPSFCYKRANAELFSKVIMDKYGYYTWLEMRGGAEGAAELYSVSVSPDFVSGPRNDNHHLKEYILADYVDKNSFGEFISVNGNGIFFPIFPFKEMLEVNSHGQKIRPINGNRLIVPIIPHLLKLLIGKNRDATEVALTALAKFGTPAISVIIKALEDSSTRSYAIKTLSRMGQTPIPILISELKKNNKSTSSAASFILGLIGRNAIPSLMKVFKNIQNRPQVRHLAQLALSGMGELAVPSLIETLGSSQTSTRLYSARALQEIAIEPENRGPYLIKQAVPALIGRFTDPSNEVRQQARYALESIDRAALPELYKALKHENRDIRESAKTVIHFITIFD